MESGDIPTHGQFKNTLFVFLQGLVHVYSVHVYSVHFHVPYLMPSLEIEKLLAKH